MSGLRRLYYPQSPITGTVNVLQECSGPRVPVELRLEAITKAGVLARLLVISAFSEDCIISTFKSKSFKAREDHESVRTDWHW